jgi:hypothetical protein
MFGGEETRETPLSHLADLADPFDYSSYQNQLILAKKLIEHGASVSIVSIPHGLTPLHMACYSGVVSNLDFVEFLLKEGADPNAQDQLGTTPLMYTMPDAPGAAIYLQNWPTTDANITNRSGASFLAEVRSLITAFSDKVALPDNPDRVQHQFCSSSGVRSKRSWWKGEPLIPISQPLSTSSKHWSSDIVFPTILAQLFHFRD